MQISKSKTTAITVTLFLLLTIAISLIAAPPATAQDYVSTGTAVTRAFIGALPNPVGVGQEVLLHLGIQDPLSSVVYGWEGLTVTVERPDGKTETLGPFKTDATGGTGTVYVPTMAGTYYLQTHFPEQRNPSRTTGSYGALPLPVNTTMLASDSPKLALIVQAEPLQYYPGSPLPTEYWTRPINAQHREWSTISGSSWMDDEYNEAPETPHVLWTKPLTIGGLAGGDLGVQGFEIGDAYEGKWTSRLILAGLLYYEDAPGSLFGVGTGTTGSPVTYHCIDLRSGEELWSKVFLDNRTISFGQLFYWDSYNYHGTFAYLWVTVGTTWYAFDAYTGDYRATITNVPSGTNIIGEKGGIYRYSINLNQGRMLLWNLSALVSMQGSFGSSFMGRTYNASDGSSRAERAWALNVTIPTGLKGSVQEVALGERVIGANVNNEEVNIWAFSLKPGQEGQLLFNNDWNAPAEWAATNQTISWAGESLDDNVGLLYSSADLTYWGFSLETGKFLWGPTEPHYYLDRYSIGRRIAYGKLYSVGQGGDLLCWDITTGELLWGYNATDPYSEFLWGNNWSEDILFISGGKVYLFHSEHSPVNPLFRGAPTICLNATTGDEIWRVDGLFRKTDWGGGPIMGDSVIAMYNTYDQRVYAIGKGPSATSVEAPDLGVPLGNSVLVKGMVTDVSPGTADSAVTMRFPNGVPAVSDDSIGEWMKYVYAQFKRPANATGVEVVVEVLDPNNNYYEVGRTISDSSGFFSCQFTPEVPGKYTIIASFAGSGAYYGSFAETAIGVEEAPSATPVPTATPAPMTDLYVTGFGAGMIIAIVVVGLLLILMLRKR